MKYVKKRNWSFLIWLDSAPNNWKDILIESGLPFAVSPLHDKDINPDNTHKKPHYHCIICYDGPTTLNCVQELTNKLNTSIPIPLESVTGMYRYFTHKDNPEKYQYNDSLIECYNSFDSLDYLTSGEIFRKVKELHNLIRDNDITEYSSLLDFLSDNDLFELYIIACTKTIVLNTYITSYRHCKLKKV